VKLELFTHRRVSSRNKVYQNTIHIWTFMLKLSYTAEHEQYQPVPLLDYAVEAEKVGFDAVWTSDHFHPWHHTNAACGFAWVWMTALAERTKKIEIGTAVTCPTFRYHPAVVAQAFATMRCMYPDRISLGLGSGESMNEAPIGFSWPSYKERFQRLEEAIQVMKLLWSGDFVSFKGKYYTLRKARLYTNPASPPPIYLAASGAKVMELAGRCCEGVLTLPLPEKQYRDVLFPALERGAKAANRDPAKVVKSIEVWVAYDEDYDKALETARFWAAAATPYIYKFGVYDPREIEEFGWWVGDKQLAQYWLIGTKPDDHIKHLEKFVKLGFQDIHVQSSSPDEFKTLEMYGKHVLPYIRSTYGMS
jgi:coenzyme F420-dependent glucose-6-phosphate dehydrogenase